MDIKLFKPVFFLVALILAVGLACGGPPAATEAPQPPTSAPTEEKAPTPTQEQQEAVPTSTEEPVVVTSGAVSNLQDVQGAVIQIEAQGTFADPEYGEYSGAGRGSGFIIDPSGIAVTNNHVVTGAALLKVWIGGDTGTVYNARILGVSECSDLAVIDIDGEGFPYLEWYAQPVTVGLDVYTAGFPLGEQEYTLTKGIVSKEDADGETNWASVDSVIMHDATINPGNSGGPLVDASGKVVAINYAAYKAADQYFAIGPDVAKPVIDQLKSGKDVDSLGVNGMAFISEDGSFAGIWVSSVKSGSPADKAGVIGGDIITTVEGFPIALDGTMSSYCDVIRTHNPTDVMGVEVYRYQTSQDLAGQFNGEPLEVVYTYTDTGTGDTGSDTPPSGYYTVYDDTSAIAVDVPAAWTEIDGSLWENSWGNQAFTAASIIASGNLDNFNNTWSEPGIWFAASRDWGRLGGYVQLLDGVKDWYSEDCDFVERGDYGDEDPVFEGGYDLWESCGDDNSIAVVIAARPRDDPLSYLVLVQVILMQDSDMDTLQTIIDTFDRVGSLP